MTPNVRPFKEQIDTLDLIRVRSFDHEEKTKGEKPATNWEKMFANHIYVQ